MQTIAKTSSDNSSISWRNSVWQWWSLAVLFLVFVLAYAWDLAHNKFGNDFYAAAEFAGAHSWKAFFYGASDFQSSITVDKPPLSLWPSSLAIRFFGFNLWSIFLPQVVMALLTGGVIYVLVRRSFSHLAGWLAAFTFACTPLVFIMFRFDNPDAMMLMWCTLAVYTLSKGVEAGYGLKSFLPAWVWYVVTGIIMGLSFLTKQLEGLMTIPALVVGILVCVRTWKKKIMALVYNFLGLILGAGWWTAIVELVPANERPFIGGSPTNDFLQLTFVYNGIKRFSSSFSQKLTQAFQKIGLPSFARGKNNHFSMSHGSPGFSRFLWSFEATQIGLLTALTLIGVILGYRWLYHWNKGTISQKVLYAVMSMWFMFFWLVFSFMGNIFHPYYALILATPMAVICGCTIAFLWRMRNQWWAKKIVLLIVVLETMTAVLTSLNGVDLTPIYIPWIIGVIGVIAFVIVVQMMWRTTYAYTESAQNRWIIASAVGLLVVTFGPSLYYLGSSYTRSITGGLPIAGPGWRANVMTPEKKVEDRIKREIVHDVLQYVAPHAEKYAWIAGTTNLTAITDPYGLEIVTGHAVMPIGGYMGVDPYPTLAQLKSIIQHHQMHYYLLTEREWLATPAVKSSVKSSLKKDSTQKTQLKTKVPAIIKSFNLDEYVQSPIYNYITHNFPHHDIARYDPLLKEESIERIYDLTRPLPIPVHK